MENLAGLTLVATVDSYNNLSTIDGDKIFEIPEFEKKIRQKTLGCAIIVGRKTWENIIPMNNRHYIILTNDEDYNPNITGKYKISVAHKPIEVLNILNKNNIRTAYVLGGISIFAKLNKYANGYIICKVRHVLHGKNKFRLNKKLFMCPDKKSYEYYDEDGKLYNWDLCKYVKRTENHRTIKPYKMFNNGI